MFADLSQMIEQIKASDFYRILDTPFFSLGDFHLSFWLLCKAVIFVSIFSFVARIVNMILHKKVYPRLNLEEGVQYVLDTTLKYLFLLVGLFTVINLLGINLGALTVFAGTLGIGIGLGVQDVMKNFISGIVILVESPVKVGDYIEVGGLPGRVRAIKARSTIVDTFDNTSVIVPNSEFISQRVVNWSYSDRVVRIAAPVGVAYGSDTQLVKKILMEVAEEHPKILSSPEPYVWFDEFGESSLNFRLYAWCKEPQNRLKIRSEINFMIDEKFRQHNVVIPFPQRDLHLKSSQVILETKANG